MARLIETGVKYFPLDTGIFSDRKIKKLLLTFGAKGFLVYIFVLCEIYKDKGYFVQCDDDFLLDIAYTLNLPEATVREIVNFCVTNVLFDKRVFDVEKALTSIGIQKRFSEIKKRSDIKILDNYKINAAEILINVTEIQNNTTLIPQKKSKVNKSKVNIESSNEDSLSSGKPPDAPDVIDYKKFINWFNSETKGIFGNLIYPLGEKRKKTIMARVREKGKQSLFDVVKRAYESDFLKGDNQRGFIATFDWMIKPSNFDKILSDNYKNHGKNQKNSKTSTSRPSVDELGAAVELGIALAKANKK